MALPDPRPWTNSLAGRYLDSGSAPQNVVPPQHRRDHRPRAADSSRDGIRRACNSDGHDLTYYVEAETGRVTSKRCQLAKGDVDTDVDKDLTDEERRKKAS